MVGVGNIRKPSPFSIRDILGSSGDSTVAHSNTGPFELAYDPTDAIFRGGEAALMRLREGTLSKISISVPYSCITPGILCSEIEPTPLFSLYSADLVESQILHCVFSKIEALL